LGGSSPILPRQQREKNQIQSAQSAKSAVYQALEIKKLRPGRAEFIVGQDPRSWSLAGVTASKATTGRAGALELQPFTGMLEQIAEAVEHAALRMLLPGKLCGPAILAQTLEFLFPPALCVIQIIVVQHKNLTLLDALRRCTAFTANQNTLIKRDKMRPGKPLRILHIF
jgi:hypothetical protein